MCLTFWDLFDWTEIAYHKKYKNEIHSKTLYQYFYAPFIHGSTDFLVYQLCSISDLWQDLISGCLQHVEQDVQVILMI